MPMEQDVEALKSQLSAAERKIAEFEARLLATEKALASAIAPQVHPENHDGFLAAIQWLEGKFHLIAEPANPPAA